MPTNSNPIQKKHEGRSDPHPEQRKLRCRKCRCRGEPRHSNHVGKSLRTETRPLHEAPEHALASRKLFTDGAEVLYDYAEHEGDTPEARSARELVVVRNDQQVFSEIVDSYLKRIDFHSDQWARVIHLPKYGSTDVVVDQQRGFGSPIFATGEFDAKRC